MRFPRLSLKSLPSLSIRDALAYVGYPTSSGETVTPRTAIDVTAVFCAARVIAEGLAQMPRRVVRERPEGGALRTDPVWDHPVARLLARRPNDWQTGFEFVEGMVFNAALAGASIAIKNVVNGEIRELLPVPPGAWTIKQQPDYSLAIRVTRAGGGAMEFGQRQVMHLRGPAMDGFTGLSAVWQAREAIGLSRSMERQQAKLAGNGGKPSGVLSFTDPIPADFRENLRKIWEERFSAHGEGGIAILDRGATFQSMQMTGVEAQHLETRRLQIEEIARAFRVQPIMLMQADKAATFASAEQMFRNHVIHTLGPWVSRFEEAATRDLLAPRAGEIGELKVDLEERSLLRGDFKDQAAYYTSALGAGGQPAWMTQNEVRAELGLDPSSDPGADRLSPGAMQPAEPAGSE